MTSVSETAVIRRRGALANFIVRLFKEKPLGAAGLDLGLRQALQRLQLHLHRVAHRGHRRLGVGMGAAWRLGDDAVDDLQLQQVLGGELDGLGGFRGVDSIRHFSVERAMASATLRSSLAMPG